MKNLRKKIGIATFACFFTLGLASGVTNAGPITEIEEVNVGPTVYVDPDVMHLADTLRKTGWINSYELSDGNVLKFFQYHSKQHQYLELRISTKENEGGVTKVIVIRDYWFDNLKNFDQIGYGTKIESCNYEGITFLAFQELSDGVKAKVKGRYNLIIKEAPKILLKKYEKDQQEKQRKQEREKKELENNILEVLK